MRGSRLDTLLQMLKAEIGDNLSVGTANDAAYRILLSNKQKQYESMFDFPFLELRADVAIAPLTRYFAMPGINLERPVKAELKYSNYWYSLDYDIGSCEFNITDTDRGVHTEPTRRWRLHDEVSIAAPADGMTANGSVGVESYSYKVSFVFPESDSDLSNAVSVASVAAPGANVIDLTAIPLDSNGYAIGRKLYRTKTGGSTYYLLATINDNVTETFADTIADTALTEVAPTSGTGLVTVFEVWPVQIASTTTILRFTGRRKLRPLVVDSDKADLDDILLVLSVAADRLTLLKHPAASGMQARALQRWQSIRASYPVRTKDIIVGGGYPEDRKRRLFVAGVAARGLGQIKVYDVDPTVEGIVPDDLSQPAECYQRIGQGPLFTWNLASKVWQ